MWRQMPTSCTSLSISTPVLIRRGQSSGRHVAALYKGDVGMKARASSVVATVASQKSDGSKEMG
jgi:hypothetical protein